jgi:hypothetical protein
VVRQRLIEVVAEIPAEAEAIGGDANQLTLGAQSLEEQHQLELEEDDRVDRGPTQHFVAIPHQVTDEAQIKLRLQ